MDEQEKKFCNKYNIRILNEKRGYRIGYEQYFTDPKDADLLRHYDRSWTDYLDGKIDSPHLVPNYEKIMVVEIPERSLDRLMEVEKMFYAHSSSGQERLAEIIIERNYEAARLRHQHPAIQAAWEQYSLMLHLASNGRDLT